MSSTSSKVFWIFLIFVVIGYWGTQVVWASSDFSQPRQTVPTRVKTNTPEPTAQPTSPASPPIATETTTPLPSSSNTPIPTSMPVSPTSQFTPTPAKLVATAKENLRIRSAPSTTASVIGQLAKGSSAQVTARTVEKDWWQIPLPNDPNVSGWISAAFTDTSGPVDSVLVIDQKGRVVSVPTATITLASPSATTVPQAMTPMELGVAQPSPSITARSRTSTPVPASSNPTVETALKVGELGVLVCIGGGFILGLLVGLFVLLRHWGLA